MDLHADQIQGFFENQLITFLLDYLSTLCKSLGLDNLTIASLIWEVLKEPTPILNFRIRCSYCYKQRKLQRNRHHGIDW
jgi:hypothetical protein